MTTKEQLLIKHKETRDWHTGEAIMWLQNDEPLYLGAKKVKRVNSMATFWRMNKPPGAKVNVRYVDWKEVFRTIQEE